MGSYCSFKVNARELFWNKSYIPTDICILFHQSEVIRYSKKVHFESEEYIEKCCLLVSSNTKLLARLRILGYTLEKSLSKAIKAITEYINEEGEYITVNLDLDSWCIKVVEIVANPSNDYFSGDEYAHYILYDSDYTLGLPLYDVRETLVILLSQFPDDTRVEIDYSDLVGGGYIDEDDDVVSLAKIQSQNASVTRENVIIVAEGVSDLIYLENSLKILHPDLENYFSFFDVKVSKSQGGAGDLVNFVKRIVGARLSNRFCILFDNDYVGLSGLKKLKNIQTPANISLMHYPDLPDFNAYPAIIDDQISMINVNGIGCSIELYFGKEILSINGSFSPISITNVDKNYHGKIVNKPLLQKRFKEKYMRTLSQGIRFDDDWSGMRSIWTSIFKRLSEYSVENIIDS
jgi:hypothetical protein